MEPYDLKVQQLTFSEDQIQEDSLDSFSNVVHYDSALIDKTTGKKPDTVEVSNSLQFAWSSYPPKVLATQRASPIALANQIPANSNCTNQEDAVCLNCTNQRAPSDLNLTNQHEPNWTVTNQKTAPGSRGQFLPTPFQSAPGYPALVGQQNNFNFVTRSTTKGEFAQQIDQLIKDVYSEVDVPFTPFTSRQTIPDWIFLHQSSQQDSRTFGLPAPRFIAQPSKVKVTHVYNQSVWSSVPSTAAQNQSSTVTQKPEGSANGQPVCVDNINHKRPPISIHGIDSEHQPGARYIQHTHLAAGSNITTLQQVVANTTATRQLQPSFFRHGKTPLYKMATGSSDTPGKTSEPFDSVAEALHLQQSVIGNKANVMPVSADVVAQIVADAQRKLQGPARTPTEAAANQNSNSGLSNQPVGRSNTLQGEGSSPAIAPPAGSNTASSTELYDLPPEPCIPDIATSRELIRQYGLDVTKSGQGLRQAPSDHKHRLQGSQSGELQNEASGFGVTNPTGNNTCSNLSDGNRVLGTGQSGSVANSTPGRFSVSDLLLDDNLSVASSNSELETLNDGATESFLKSLPPFKTVSLKDIVPESGKHQVEALRFSPPVKETSFRPVANVGTQNKGENIAQSFVTDSGVMSPEREAIITAVNSLPQPKKSSYVIPKPGPLFQSTPRKAVENASQQNLMHSVSVSSMNSDSGTLLDEVKREKAKLEGQLEMLSIEAQATLQERAELQAQVASLKRKLMGQKAQKTDSEKDYLKSDVEGLKQVRVRLENSLSDVQRQLEEKAEEGRNLQEELSQSQDQCDHLNMRMKEIRDDVKTKEITIQALKGKVAELYVEVQSSMHVKMEADNETRSAKSELLLLQSTKDWYQQQLEVATRARSELQKDLTMLQAQAASQSSIVERLKTENAKLRQQFCDIQNKALRDKEMLAKHLEVIESDMMDREAAFQEIQRERSFLEDAFSTKIQTAEDEKNRIALLMQMTNDLENQLDKAHSDLKKKQNQIVQLENENIELMKKLSLSQEAVIEKDGVVEELKQSMIEIEARLKAFQNSIADKDEELLKLGEEKAKTEIALNAALQEKLAVDEVLDSLKADMGKVEASFKLMRQELNSRSAEVHHAKSSSKVSEERMEGLNRDLENERRNYELVKSEFDSKAEQVNELQGQKINLESEVMILRQKLSAMENSYEEAVKEKEHMDAELVATREKLEQAQENIGADKQVEVESVQKSENEMRVNSEEFTKVQDECVQLKEKMTRIEKDGKKDLMKQKAKAAKLGQDLNAVKTELMERQRMFDENIEVLSAKLREVVSEKERLETELSMTHRKYELGMLEQKDQIGTELQTLASELQQVQLDKQSLESQYVELQHARDLDLQTFQQQLSALEGELHASREAQRESLGTVEHNEELALQLEKEKGRLAGVMQSNATLKQHVSQLEGALASRESTLLELQTQWSENAREHERESALNLRRVQTLEETLQKEKDGQRDVRKQIGQKITENKKLKRQNDTLKQDAEILRQDLAQRVQEVGILEAELETNKQEVLSRVSEMASLESENKSLERQLERVQQQLQDNIAREPVIQEQMKSIQWQLELKCRELQSADDQLKQAEDRQLVEMNSLRHQIQEKTGEIDSLKVDLSVLRQEKHSQQAKIAELRAALKSSIQHHKLTEKISRLAPVGGSGDNTGLELPPLPFDMNEMDRLLQETTVRALESKPLDNLQNCLLNLRSEISGLQTQMDVHNTTLHTSSSTWSSVEQQVQELCTVVQTITNTTLQSATTDSLAAAAVTRADSVFDI